MAEEEKPINGFENEAATHPELDVQKLHAFPSEQQDLYLLTFTSDLARHVASLDADGATAQQDIVRKEVYKIVKLSSPAPTRIIRNNLGQALAGVFTKGDRKRLFETANELLGVVNSSKSEKHIKSKHAAVHCLGALFEAAGSSAISLSSNVCLSILRQVKAASNHAGFRAAIFRALSRIVKGIGRSADEAVVRDIWKSARSTGPSDKSLLVQSAIFWCVEQIFRHTSYLDNSNDFERLCSLASRCMESSSPTVRKAAANCLAAVYVKAYSANPNPVVRPGRPRKQKPKTGEDGEVDDEPDRSGSPAPNRPVTSLSFGLIDILRGLSAQYHRSGTSNRARGALALCYTRVCKGLGEAVVEKQYTVITRHLFEDLLGSPIVLNNRYRLLMTRKFVRIILGDVLGEKMLSETAQLNALKFLVNSIIKDYPQSDIKERPEPTKEALIAGLDIAASLIRCLESAVSSFSDNCREALIQVLQHPSYSVQIHASKCLQALVLACPHQLLPSVTICMNSVNRELGQLTGPRRSHRRCLGFAFGLASTISTSSEQPLYGDVDVYSKVLSQATSILKSSSSSDLRVSSTQIQVAWILMGGLMSLGPSFVKIHLSQLLLLWRNALPKPLTNDNIRQRDILELSFLAHVRECALGSICSFLTFNARLLTVDVSKRLATMLQYTMSFLNSLPVRKTTEDAEKFLSPALQLQDYDLMVRRRVFQCYTQLISLSPHTGHEALLQSNLLSMAASSFADSANISTDTLSSTIASSTGTFESIWDISDNSAFGLNGIVSGLDVRPFSKRHEARQRHWLSLRGTEAEINRTTRSPTCSDLEHDSVQLYTSNEFKAADPLGTGTVNAAIHLFAAALQFQSSRVQEGVLEQVSTLLAASHGQQNAAKDMAVTVNVVTALLLALQAATGESTSGSGTLKNQNVEKAIQELLHASLGHDDLTIRHLTAEAIGRLCKSSGNDFTSREVAFLVDLIVSNRDPNIRAGCAMALGCIHAELGGMSAGFHMKNILGVLMSLASDPHPTVHFWAVDGLARVAESAGLAFSAYVSSCLGTIAQLYFLDTHNEETGPLGSSNADVDLPCSAAISRCLDAMINVLGPDLQDMTKNRNMILTLTYQFQGEESTLVSIESLKCLEHLSMYAPNHISFKPYIRQLQSKICSEEPDVRDSAIMGLYNAMRRGAEDVLATVDPSLEEKLWLVLQDTYGKGVMKNLILNWVEQSGPQQPKLWISRIQKVLTRVKAIKTDNATAEVADTPAEPDLQDEEVAGFNAASKEDKEGATSSAETGQELLRWQVRCTAMECLNEILSDVAKEVLLQDESPKMDELQPRVADMVRIAFSASTASVVEMRILGIQIIGRVLEIFGKAPDPDFPEATLLEQYQAQISSALTPAFAADSSPILAAEAVGVCGLFISTGIVTNIDRMGRILRLLVSSLEDFSSSDATAIGDLKGLSSNAQVMVRLAVFTAWAELQIASHEQKYLQDVIGPHLKKLTPLWLISLREYAKLKFEPEVSTTGALEGGLDSLYAALSRETLLQFYQAAWLRFVDAIANLIEEDSEFVSSALDDKEESAEDGALRNSHDINYRDEPVAFFFVLFGISFEALIDSITNESSVRRDKILEIIQAMTKILRPSVAGLAIYQDAIFSETMDLLDRLALTEGIDVQTVVVEIARNLCLEHPSARRTPNTPGTEELLSDDIDQLFELTRIAVLIISRHLSNLTPDNAGRSTFSGELVPLIVLALDSLVDSAAVFPSIIKADLHACIFHVFASIFSNVAAQGELVPHALPIFRRFVTALTNWSRPETTSQLRSALGRFLKILKTAQRREFEAAAACEKNILLAITILLTSSSSILHPSDPLINQFLNELADCLGNRLTTKTAAGLCRSLVLLPATRGGQTESAIAAKLLPYLIGFLARPSEVEGTEEARPIISHALATFAAGLPSGQQRSAAFRLVVPTLLQRAEVEGETVYKESSARLLDLAGKSQADFRAVVEMMTTEQKDLLQEIFKAGGVVGSGTSDGGQVNGEADEVKPSITLRMDF